MTLVGSMILPNRRDLFGTHFRFHPVTGESERQRLWFGLVVAREREQMYEWFTENCGGGVHAPQDDPAWRTGDGGSIYGGVRIWVRGLMDTMERYEVPPQDRCVVIRYQIEHPVYPVWCEIGDDKESLRWGSQERIVMRWENGKTIEVVEK